MTTETNTITFNATTTPHLCNDGRCYFDEATLEPRVPQEPFDRDRARETPEFKWSLVAWAILLVAGAFGIVGLEL